MARDESMLPLVGRSETMTRERPRGWRPVVTASAWIALGMTIAVVALQSHAVPSSEAVLMPNLRNDATRLSVDPATVSMGACAHANASDQKPKNTWFLSNRDDPEVVLTAIPHAKSIEELPSHWDWRDYNGTGISLVTSIQNQMVPKPCGSCWAFATISALSDRIRIAHFRKYGKLGPEVVLSPQVLLDCGMLSFGSCEGGDPRFAHKWIHENGIVDTTCNPYIASHPSWFGVTGGCGATQCRRCTLQGECHVLKNPKKYFISEYGTLNATTPEEFELEAMNEIYHRGPIVVSMFSHAPAYVNYQGGFVLRDATDYGHTTHVVSLIGWGTDEHHVKYWIVRNSDGTNWGDDGFFLVERGTNTYRIEGHGAWAVPIV